MGLQQRDALIVRLNEAGWSLRQIGRHPRVRLTPEGVPHVLRRLDADDQGWELDPLALWRDARTGNDPRAVELWTTYQSRTDELADRLALERYGHSLDECPPDTQQALRGDAADRVVVELYDELEAAR